MELTTTKPGKLAVSERDVALAVLYGTPCIILLRHQPGASRSTGIAFVYVYTVHKYAYLFTVLIQFSTLKYLYVYSYILCTV